MTVKEFSWNKPTDLVENKGDGREELRNKATRFRAQWGSENGTTTDCGPLELTWMPAKCVPGPLGSPKWATRAKTPRITDSETLIPISKVDSISGSASFCLRSGEFTLATWRLKAALHQTAPLLEESGFQRHGS